MTVQAKGLGVGSAPTHFLKKYFQETSLNYKLHNFERWNKLDLSISASTKRWMQWVFVSTTIWKGWILLPWLSFFLLESFLRVLPFCPHCASSDLLLSISRYKSTVATLCILPLFACFWLPILHVEFCLQSWECHKFIVEVVFNRYTHTPKRRSLWQVSTTLWTFKGTL